MRLLKEFQSKVDRFHLDRRRIERQKSLVDIGKIMLVGEFYHAALGPLERKSHSPFARSLLRKIEDCGEILKLWINTNAIDTFPVSRSMIARDYPDYTYANLFGADVGQLERLAGFMQNNGSAPSDYVRNALDTHAKWLQRTETYPAIRLGEALIAMQWRLQVDIEPREWKALLRGDGDTVAVFWDDINRLQDFSGYFPNRPSYKPRDPKRKRQSVNEAKPELGWSGV